MDLSVRRCLLVIDDDHEVIELVSSYVNYQGYDVVASNNGLEARKLIVSQTFQAVFCDIRMPGTGLELLKKRVRIFWLFLLSWSLALYHRSTY
ncbi:MAG TPA: response regulator [Oligoflexus sp.]|uniref:response regulator n=1 Tax=Oligoflexus sp. TaxID=1971216 RepID=UPI002D6313DB|nr:response regulator [Oligoflexus sp.]HYX39851.1 response regulator [Oligoflexus sp.]